MKDCDKKLTINFVKFNSTTYKFRRPIELKIQLEDGRWLCESELLLFYGYAGSEKGALKTFDHLFAVNWAEIALASDHKLSPSVMVLKNIMLDLVASVTVDPLDNRINATGGD